MNRRGRSGPYLTIVAPPGVGFGERASQTAAWVRQNLEGGTRRLVEAVSVTGR